MNKRALKADYGNWVPKKLLYVPGTLSAICTVLSIKFWWLGFFAAVFLVCFAYFVYARWYFAPKGKNLQQRIQSLILEHLDWDGSGKALDIGCGSGALTIGIAKNYSNVYVTGVDYWGGTWEYSKGMCERNATIEGVKHRVTFLQASASSLPFDDKTFDVVISNLTFHEVADSKDKRLPIKEALRVLRNGGVFVFQDLFLWQRLFGTREDLLDLIKKWGVERVADSKSLPPHALGT